MRYGRSLRTRRRTRSTCCTSAGVPGRPPRYCSLHSGVRLRVLRITQLLVLLRVAVGSNVELGDALRERERARHTVTRDRR
eukprot:3935645-Rhodomonas_salina.2